MSEAARIDPPEDAPTDVLADALARDYEWGFTTEIESDTAPIGLSTDTIRFTQLFICFIHLFLWFELYQSPSF